MCCEGDPVTKSLAAEPSQAPAASPAAPAWGGTAGGAGRGPRADAGAEPPELRAVGSEDVLRGARGVPLHCCLCDLLALKRCARGSPVLQPPAGRPPGLSQDALRTTALSARGSSPPWLEGLKPAVHVGRGGRGGAGLRGAGPPGPPLSRPWRWGRGEAECPEVGPGDGGLTCPVSPRAPCAGCFRDNAPLRGRTCTRTVTATPPWGAGAQTPPAGPGRVLARGTGPAGATRSHFTPPTTFPALSGQSLSNARGLRVSGDSRHSLFQPQFSSLNYSGRVPVFLHGNQPNVWRLRLHGASARAGRGRRPEPPAFALPRDILPGLTLVVFPLSPRIMQRSDGTSETFPGNLVREQAGDMAARPLLIESPLKFHSCAINY